ncbi:MAG: YqhV family protein [Desulfocucumaceae bacterium]
MFYVFEKIVLGMALLRILSSAIEFTAAMLMLRYNSVETAFKINAILAFIGPSVMITVTSLGLVGLAGKISFQGLAFIIAGVTSIFIGMSKM